MAATSSELKIHRELISPSLKEIIQTRAIGKTPILFALRFLTKQIIQEHAVLSTTIKTGAESSVLSHTDEQAKLKIIDQLTMRYADKIDKLGGIDGVLDNLQAYIVSMIKKLDPKCSDPVKKPEHRAFLVSEASQEIGTYKTALRALLDAKTLTWSSTLHQGSTAAYAGVPLRQLLALYWVAASDESMSMDYESTATEGIAKERKEKLDFAKSNFVTVMSEIRRAHNERGWDGSLGSLNNPIDNPSCPMGTFGRIVSSAVIHNKAAYFMDVYKSDELINQIMIFIKKEFQKLPAAKKILIGRYISDQAIVMIDSAKENQEALLAFIKELTTPDMQKELIKYLSDNCHDFKFLFNLKPGVRLDTLNTLISEIMGVHLQSLMTPNDYAPDATLVNTILSEGFTEGFKAEFTKNVTISKPIDDALIHLRSVTFETTTQLHMLRQALLHHSVAKPRLFSDPKAGLLEAKMIAKRISELQASSRALYEETLKKLKALVQETVDKLACEGIALSDIDEVREKLRLKLMDVVNSIVQVYVPRTTLSRLEQNNASMEQLLKLIKQAEASPTSCEVYVRDLPQPRGCDKLDYRADPKEIARYFVALAQLIYPKADEREAKLFQDHNLELIRDLLNAISIQFSANKGSETAILEEIKKLLSSVVVDTELNICNPGSSELIKEVLAQQYPVYSNILPEGHLHIVEVFNYLASQFETKEMEEIQDIIEKRISYMYDSKILTPTMKPAKGESKLQAEAREKEAQEIKERKEKMDKEHKGIIENRTQWIAMASKVYNSSTIQEERMNRLHMIVVLTLMSNLQIAHFNVVNAQGLKSLCYYYMSPETHRYISRSISSELMIPRDMLLKGSPQDRISWLQEHLCIVCCRLNGLETFFATGNITLLTGMDAEALIAKVAPKEISKLTREKVLENTKGIIRLSVTDPSITPVFTLNTLGLYESTSTNASPGDIMHCQVNEDGAVMTVMLNRRTIQMHRVTIPMLLRHAEQYFMTKSETSAITFEKAAELTRVTRTGSGTGSVSFVTGLAAVEQSSGALTTPTLMTVQRRRYKLREQPKKPVVQGTEIVMAESSLAAKARTILEMAKKTTGTVAPGTLFLQSLKSGVLTGEVEAPSADQKPVVASAGDGVASHPASTPRSLSSVPVSAGSSSTATATTASTATETVAIGTGSLPVSTQTSISLSSTVQATSPAPASLPTPTPAPASVSSTTADPEILSTDRATLLQDLERRRLALINQINRLRENLTQATAASASTMATAPALTTASASAITPAPMPAPTVETEVLEDDPELQQAIRMSMTSRP